MKKTFLLLLLLITPIEITYSQSASSLKTDLQKFYNSFNDIDLEAIAGSLCSDKSQSELYDALDHYFLNDDFKFRYVLTNVKYNIGDLSDTNGKTTAMVNFRNVVRITYFKPIDVTKLQTELKTKFGAQTISYQKARNAFLIVYNAKLLAIWENGPHWKFAFDDNTLPDSISGSCNDNGAKKEADR